MMPSLDIVIVNWNSGSSLSDCLSAVTCVDSSTFFLKSIIVVDNASRDDSLECCSQVDLPVTVIRNSDNLGFARACNDGAKLGAADYLLFLNPDVMLSSVSISSAVAFLEENRQTSIGICGVRLLDPAGGDTASYARLPGPISVLCKVVGLDHCFSRLVPSRFLGSPERSVRREVGQVIGACFFVRRQLYESLGGFDERYFMYYEEVDLSLRARALGYKSYHLGDVTAIHVGGACSKHVMGRRLLYLLQSRLAYSVRHFSWLAYLAILAATVTVEPFVRVLRAGLRLSLAEANYTLEAYRALYSSFFRGRSDARALFSRKGCAAD